MDLNYLFRRHQISLAKGRSAPSPEARVAHRAFARSYAQRIAALQRESGASAPLVAA